MSRNRFFEIKSFIHTADNQSLSESRMAQVEPIYDLLNKKIQQFGIVHEDLSIDESMVPYYGRHSCKQFIRAKPIRFGYKLWVLASATGLPYKIEIYQGKSTGDADEPLGTRVVTKALEICENPKDHSVFFDNFFSSYQLITDLGTKGFRATGTMRSDRIMKYPLIDVKVMKKKERGSFDFRCDEKAGIVRWNDNSVVTIGSNAYGVEPIGNVMRWIKGKGKENVQQTAVIAAYNRRMGGVDLLDRALSDLRPVIRGKKWYWPLVINALNIAFVFSWQLYRVVAGEPVPQKDLRRHIVSIMIRKSAPRITDVYSRPTRAHKIADEVRHDGVGHYPISSPVRKCTICERSCRNACEKCKPSLHVKTCFQIFHEK